MLIIQRILSTIYGELNKYVSDTALSIFTCIVSFTSQQPYDAGTALSTPFNR